MANHDYIVSNGPGQEVRQDWNDALQAVVTQNSGANEPPTKYAGMIWLDLSDTTKPDGIFRFRNQANNAWKKLIPDADGVLVPNLNADMVDGMHASDFAQASAVSSIVGTLAYFACAVAPPNYLKCNGATLFRSAYPELYAFAAASGLMAASQAARDANWALWGPGDGTNTFQLPDLRGVFLRAADESRGVDAGRGIGTTQAAAFQSHNHSASTDTQGWHGHDGYTNAAGAHNHFSGISRNVMIYGGGGPTDDIGESGANPIYTGSVGDHQHYFSSNGNGSHAHNVTVSAAGSTETRPINAAYPMFIRYR